MLASSRMAPRVSCSRLASNPALKHPGHLGVAALLVSRCNLPGTELALHVEAALPVWGWVGGVERPNTMGEELTSHIIHPLAATALAVHDNSPAFKACHVDGVECQERRIIGKSE